ncbi:PREDICTED: glycine, alanine and asparagine-rich protein-like [Nicrophorus vespilloides]|uniref:Glycine, alanine and asparagine-rich protein-like n=1 Tax=Nicrophorus vespilloides TaxID=110193 RepID=A0ABM1MWR1_NICVS|nr:PREDICTED: glycine, alanine and asparagine-rich protein-like [Nicrophorus vespilloides]
MFKLLVFLVAMAVATASPGYLSSSLGYSTGGIGVPGSVSRQSSSSYAVSTPLVASAPIVSSYGGGVIAGHGGSLLSSGLGGSSLGGSSLGGSSLGGSYGGSGFGGSSLGGSSLGGLGGSSLGGHGYY